MAEQNLYKQTLNLPDTALPMRADMARREKPEFIDRWAETRVYERLLEQNANRPRWVFHDGPPYANGSLHYGHLLNRTLKDIVVKHRSMSGLLCRFVPGWDCHGLPIELNVVRQPDKARLGKLDLRRACAAEARKWVDVQREEMRRLGTFAVWQEPYLTLDPGYEAAVLRAFAKFVEQGLVYRGRKPVFWCPTDRTALAEAEVEYAERTSPSIYVRFPIADRLEALECFGLKGARDDGLPLAALIWTTTPWTLPANLALAVHPAFVYRVVRVVGARQERLIVAEALVDAVLKTIGKTGAPEGDPVQGAALAGLVARHPFADRDSPVLGGEHVTLEAGTGIVHTAPGHGEDDYRLGQAHGLEPFAPVDDAGKFTAEAAPWAGQKVFDANGAIVKLLDETGMLASRPSDTVRHSYPHCWRCKNPVIFRATAQWFIRLDAAGTGASPSLRARALAEIDSVRWIPPWGRDRIRGMIETRPDWCISRQRAWGVPIPAFYCEGCDAEILSAPVVRHVAGVFEKSGADAYFERPAAELLPAGFKCPECAGDTFRKEEDILDVWFESGASFAAVCEEGKDLGLPVELYLEGSDQHRGWFHSALLIGIATGGHAPYKAVLTHGFVLDDKGQAYSKSLKNYVAPDKVINQQGAEIIRLWAAYEDYRNDVRFSPEHLKHVSESYRKVRNTFRFLLGNLAGFDPEQDGVAPEREIDRWALALLADYVAEVRRAYEEYEFRAVFALTVERMSVELSAVYLDVLKDRLYCGAKRSADRRAAQSVLFAWASAACRALAPILSFTAEEVWRLLPRQKGDPDSVFLAGFPSPEEGRADRARIDRWKKLLALRSIVTVALETERVKKAIGASLEAHVILGVDAEAKAAVADLPVASIEELFIVSKLTLEDAPQTTVRVERAPGNKCARCWRYTTDVGRTSPADVCARCAEVLAHP